MAVYATDLTRESIWDAFLNRRTYAVTGDKIQARFSVNDAVLGEMVTGAKRREITFEVETCDFLSKIEVLKNERLIHCIAGTETSPDLEGEVRAKIRIEWGWGRKENEVGWDGELSLSDGRILSVETCFSGLPILAPQDHEVKEESLPHKLISVDERECAWYSYTTGNVTMKHQTTQALIVEVEMPLKACIHLTINGNDYEHDLATLLEGSRSHFMRGLLTEAVRIHRAVPVGCYTFRDSFIDDESGDGVDYYRLRISQKNNQWAWLTPVWVTGQ
jgi:hypothetical protein